MAESNEIILYAHRSCPQLPPVLAMLKHSQVDYTYINIHEDEDARERVRQINNGYESVPTLVFADGSTLTEPSANVLKHKLESLGYKVGIMGLIYGNAFYIIMGAIILFAILRFMDVI